MLQTCQTVPLIIRLIDVQLLELVAVEVLFLNDLAHIEIIVQFHKRAIFTVTNDTRGTRRQAIATVLSLRLLKLQFQLAVIANINDFGLTHIGEVLEHGFQVTGPYQWRAFDLILLCSLLIELDPLELSFHHAAFFAGLSDRALGLLLQVELVLHELLRLADKGPGQGHLALLAVTHLQELFSRNVPVLKLG